MPVQTSSDISTQSHCRQRQTAQCDLQEDTVVWVLGFNRSAHLLLSGVEPESVSTNGELVCNLLSSLYVGCQRMDLHRTKESRTDSDVYINLPCM